MIQQLISTIHAEYRLIFRNSGVVLVLIFAPLIYSLLYSSAYAEQVATEIPVALIDHSHSHSSRELIAELSASPYIDIRYRPTDMQAAKSLLFDYRIHGIIYIPDDYEKLVLQGNQRWISLYLDASYFLMYRQTLLGVSGAISSLKSATPSVVLQSHTLFNPSLGYGTFIMPAVLLVILQQTALMGIGMAEVIGRRRRSAISSPIVTLLGKLLVYSTIYALLCGYIFTIHYHIFGYPQSGELWSVVVVVASYMLCTITLAIALSRLYRRVETPLIAIIWSSIPILLLSGASLPTEAFPRWMHTIGLLLPSSSAVTAFIRVQSMGATLAQVMPELCRLWALTAIYAAISIKNKVPEQQSLPGYPLSHKSDIHTLL